MGQHVSRIRRDGIEILALRRPPANAMDVALLEELRDAFIALASDDSVRAIVLTADAALDLRANPDMDAQLSTHRYGRALRR